MKSLIFFLAVAAIFTSQILYAQESFFNRSKRCRENLALVDADPFTNQRAVPDAGEVGIKALFIKAKYLAKMGFFVIDDKDRVDFYWINSLKVKSETNFYCQKLDYPGDPRFPNNATGVNIYRNEKKIMSEMKSWTLSGPFCLDNTGWVSPPSALTLLNQWTTKKVLGDLVKILKEAMPDVNRAYLDMQRCLESHKFSDNPDELASCPDMQNRDDYDKILNICAEDFPEISHTVKSEIKKLRRDEKSLHKAASRR